MALSPLGKGRSSYRDGYSFTWANGRQLTAISQNNNTLASYTYNADGLRTSKTVNGVTTNYYWINGILQGQKTGDEYIIFLYDESGTAYGMLVKNGTTESTYYYVRNLQGDIIGILDSTGVQVVSYTYGAWGDILSVSGTLASTVGQQNPLRYRGYYYDSETGFYYLQSRYYDTVTQRFVNADGFVSTGQGILGNNMFVYCWNNPIMYSDPSGMCPYNGTVADFKRLEQGLPPMNCTCGYSIPQTIMKSGAHIVHFYSANQDADNVSKITKNNVYRVVDYRTGKNPNMQIRDSYKVSNKKTLNAISKIIMKYNKDNPSSTKWNRSIKSIVIEWEAHNDIYSLYPNTRCQHVDLDNSDEGVSYIEFWERAIISKLKEIF